MDLTSSVRRALLVAPVQPLGRALTAPVMAILRRMNGVTECDLHASIPAEYQQRLGVFLSHLLQDDPAAP